MTARRWPEIDRLLQAALERPPAEREAFVRDACRDDAELAAEVRTMLAHAESAEHFLETQPSSARAPLQTPERVTLAQGTRLGPYEVRGLIGAGGMGEVYKARDTRLDRTVALKILPPQLSADPDRRARFEREARTIAALSHPHICALHDVGTAEIPSPESPPQSPVSITYLVMEHLVGETLAQRLRKGPLPVVEALEIGAQIAEALDAAHKHGILHRDLKPANVMLTRSGAKLVDFGLAKLRPAAAVPADSSARAHTDHVTETGEFIGTIPYMAPEQVEGRPVDARTDLWAFGCVLYEMVAGRRAFAGETSGSLIGAILAKEPEPLATRQPLTPPSLARLVARCLAKDPDGRWDSAHDVADELRWIAQTGTMRGAAEVSGADAGRSSGATSAPWWRRRAALAVIVFAAGAVAGVLAVLWSRPAPSGKVVSFTVEVPAGRVVSELALSPDASHLAYVGAETNPPSDTSLFVRRLDQIAVRELPGTQGASSPFFSPDGQWVGFFSGLRLKKVSVNGGGEPIPLCEMPGPYSAPFVGQGAAGAVWTDDHTIVAATAAGLWRVPDNGAVRPTLLTAPDSTTGELYLASPLLFPDAKTVLFSIFRGAPIDPMLLGTVTLDTGERGPGVGEGSHALLVGGEYLTFGTSSTANLRLSAARFDASRAHLDSEAITVIDAVARNYFGPMYALSRTGDLAYVPLPAARPTSVLRVDRHGNEVTLYKEPRGLLRVMSLDGTGQQLLLSSFERSKQVGLQYTLEKLDVSRRVSTPLAAGRNPHAAIWSPDGQQVLFSANPADGGSANLFIQTADGSGTPDRLVKRLQHGDPGSWSLDGRWAAYAELGPDNYDLWKVDMVTREASLFLRTPDRERWPAIAPNGRWLAYASNASGEYEVYVENFPAGGNRQKVSTTGGTEPLWNRDGSRLLFRDVRDGSRLMAVSVGAEGISPRPAEVVLVGRGQFDSGETFGPVSYAIAPDEQHFYFLRSEPLASEPTRIQVILNWADELVKRLGGS